MLSVLATTNCLIPTTTRVQIQKFNENPVIYFNNEASIVFSTTNWNIIAYFDLTQFEAELETLTKHMKEIEEIRKKHLFNNSVAADTTLRISTRISELHEKHELIFGKTITKRSPFDIIGNIAYALFGTLDSNFARQYVQDMNKLKNNDEHLLQLLKNQTSIIDSTLNIIKNDEKELETQNKLIADLTAEVKELIQQQYAMRRITTLANQIEHLLTRYERQQEDIIDIITHTNGKNIAKYILTPRQWREQVNIIRGTVQSERIPENIYDNIRMKSFRAGKTIIFKLIIPLITNTKFFLYRIIPIPIFKEGSAAKISTENKFIAVDNDRQTYQFMTDEKLKECIEQSDNSLICFGPNQFFTQYSNTCEWNILNKLTYENCVLTNIIPSNTFIEVSNNQWIFAFYTIELCNVICERSVEHIELSGEGLIQINQDCTVNSLNQKIMAHNELSSNKKENVKISSEWNWQIVDQLGNTKEETNVTSFRKTQIDDLKKRVKSLKNQSVLPEKSISPNPYRHIEVLMLTVLGAATVAYVLWKLKKMKKKIVRLNVPPKPESRTISRAISMPNF